MIARSIPALSMVLLGVVVLAGCGTDRPGNGGGLPPGPAPTTDGVTATAATTSEDGEPFPINNGAFAFNDTSDLTDPRVINR